MFQCKAGTVLMGSEFSECQGNGIWSGLIPQCKGKLAKFEGIMKIC